MSYQVFSHMGYQASCGRPLIKESFIFHYVALQIFNLSRSYSTFWISTFQIMATSLCWIGFINISGSQFSEFYSISVLFQGWYSVGVNLRFAAYVCKRVGKLTLSAIGGGILVFQVQDKDKCIFISWLEPFLIREECPQQP